MDFSAMLAGKLYPTRKANRPCHRYDLVSLVRRRLFPLRQKAMKTFERYFIADRNTHTEQKCLLFFKENEDFCCRVLAAFGLPPTGHIINGHTPVKVRKGETPIKANGRLLVIDGDSLAPINPSQALLVTRCCQIPSA